MSLESPFSQETPGYLDGDLLTYIGNKRALLPLINSGIDLVCAALGKEKLRFLDLFAGSGVVSRLMKARASFLWANDAEYYARIVNACYLRNARGKTWQTAPKALESLRAAIKAAPRPGFLAELYAPHDDNAIAPYERVFYTKRNADYLDTARQHIGDLPPALQTLFLGPLLVDASIHTNTGGVFKGFYKGRDGRGAFGGAGGNALTRITAPISVRLPVLSRHACPVQVTQKDALTLAQSIDEAIDLVYLDPPYNQHPYGSNYFMLNLIASYQRPKTISPVSGIPTDWTRSAFNKPHEAAPALFEIIDALKARFFLISYNSEGFITPRIMKENLRARGKVQILQTRYNTFRASRNLAARAKHVTEYLFLLDRAS